MSRLKLLRRIYLMRIALDNAHDAIARVRELHKPRKYRDGDELICSVCLEYSEDFYGEVFAPDYPCDTIKALDGEQ